MAAKSSSLRLFFLFELLVGLVAFVVRAFISPAPLFVSHILFVLLVLRFRLYFPFFFPLAFLLSGGPHPLGRKGASLFLATTSLLPFPCSSFLVLSPTSPGTWNGEQAP